MSARAETIRTITEGRAERISIEGEPEPIEPPKKQPHRIAMHRYKLSSGLRGCSTELSILEGHHLGVHIVRPDREVCKYQFDLRYANPKPVRVRRISWTWLIVTAGLLALGSAALATAWSRNALFATGGIGGAAALGLSLITLVMFLRRTTESLEFRSEHGDTALVAATGGLGSARAGRKFFVQLIKSIYAAKQERPQSKQQFLRDEMREHHRLRELGVLTQEEYEQSKARILASH
jgi:hypothetical protein